MAFTLSGTLVHVEDYSGTMKRADGSEFDYAGTRLSVLVDGPDGGAPVIQKVKVSTEQRPEVEGLTRGDFITLSVVVRAEVTDRGAPRLGVSFGSLVKSPAHA